MGWVTNVAESSEPFSATFTDSVVSAGVVARVHVVDRNNVTRPGTTKVCGFVYSVRLVEVVVGDLSGVDTITVFSRLEHDFRDRAPDYLVVAAAWDYGRDTPMADLAKELATPGDDYCAPDHADFVLDKSQQSMFLIGPLSDLPGDWVYEERSSIFSDAEMIRMVRKRQGGWNRTAYFWEDVMSRMDEARQR
jgi:hypothetical protein